MLEQGWMGTVLQKNEEDLWSLRWALPQAAGWPGTALPTSGLTVMIHNRDNSSGVTGGYSNVHPCLHPAPHGPR